MNRNDGIPSAAELWAAMQAQQATLEEQVVKIGQLELELERQRRDRMTLERQLAELTGGRMPSEPKLSRAALLKAVAAGAAGLAGAGMLTAPEIAQEAGVVPGPSTSHSHRAANSPRLLPNIIDASRYADLGTAVRAVGPTTATLVVTEALPVVASVSVPRNVSLCFTGAGRLTVASGVTVTIAGPVTAEPYRHVFALADSTAAVHFAVGAIPELWVEWFGARGDASSAGGSGTDSTAAIQAAINAVPPFGGVDVCFSGGAYRVTSTILVSSANAHGYKMQMRLLGRSGRGGNGGFNGSCCLFWDGDSATTPLLALHTRDSIVEGLGFRNCAGRRLLRAIDIDAGESTTYTCTANKVVDCSFVKVAGAGSAFTDGIAVGARARGNCEFMQFHDCTFDGLDHSGILFPGGAAEPFDCEFAHCQFLNQPYGILGTGSGSWAGGVRQCSFESLSNYGLSTQSHHFVLVEACDSENCAYLVNAPSGQVAMIGGRYAPLGCSTAPGSEYVHVGSGGMLGVHFEATDVNCRITGMASTIGCVFSTVAPFTPNPYGGLPFAIGCSGATGNNQGYQSLARDVSPTVGGAGSASAPPANPAGYIVLELHQGGPVKVPYYNP